MFFIYKLTENVEYLLEFNVDLSIKNSQKNDAMYLACFNKNAVIFEKILRKINDFEPKINGNLMVLAIKKSRFCFFCNIYKISSFFSRSPFKNPSK